MKQTEFKNKNRVLIVDDQPANIRLLSNIINDRYTVQVATNGEKALSIAFGDNPPDLILLDIIMPEMDGYEVCKTLKNNVKTSDIPIIFITAKKSDDDEEYGLKLGAVDYITKPFNVAIVKARVKTHIQLKNHNDKLENIIEKRTYQLRKAKNRLEILHKEEMDFLKYLSHEINTPLNWVGMSEYIDKAECTEENAEYIEIIELGFKRIDSLIKNVFSYFSFARNELELKIVKLHLNSIVLSILEQHQNNTKNITFQTQIDDNLFIKADKNYLTTVLNIIIENALYFSNKNDCVVITTQIDSTHIKLMVTDKGKGIIKEQIDKLFSPFCMDEFHRNEDGFGLHLPMAKRIANEHGWEIIPESNGENQGTTFIIIFPKCYRLSHN